MTPDTKIEFTPEEAHRLAEIVREGAAALAKGWDLLVEIAERTGHDWQPTDRGIADIMHDFASMLTGPQDAVYIKTEEIIETFSDPSDWGMDE